MLLQDLRFTFRSLRRDWAFSVISILILALGIGATTAVFSVINAVLLQPLPFENAERLAWVSYDPPPDASSGLSAVAPRVDVFEDWRERNRSFESLSSYNAFFSFGSHRLTGGPEPRRLMGVRVADDFFDVLGVTPLAGRSFNEQEALLEGPPAVILSYGLWQGYFAGDPSIVGQPVLLDDEAVTVVGIMPESLDFGAVFAPGTRVDLFTPLHYEQLRRWGNTLGVIGRLRPGISVASAHAELAAISEQIREDRPELRELIDAKVVSLADHVHGSTRRPLLVLLICVGAVLLIACANISNLQLARSASRRKEIAIRSALGAGQPRVLRQLLTESMVLSTLGALGGLLVAYGATGAIAKLQAVSLPLLYRVGVDGRALLVAAILAIAASRVFGLAPALQVGSLRLQEALKDSGRGSSASGWQQRARSTLVVAEIAMACMLVVGAGLLGRSFVEVLEVDLGFAPNQALTVNVEGADNLSRPERVARIERLIEAVETVPGVQSASVGDALPLDRNRTWGIFLPGRQPEPEETLGSFVICVAPGYLRTLGIPLLSGQAPSQYDTAESQPVAVINAALARDLFPGQDPVGRLVSIGGEDRTVIGVAANVRHGSVETSGGFETYLPISQVGASGLEMVVRAQGSEAAILEGVREALRTADPALPLAGLRPLSTLVDRAVSPRRFFLFLLGCFAIFALFLAALGMYGVISYSVGQRSGEIGIRMALGATRNRVRFRVLRETLSLAGVGILLGSIGAFVLGRAMNSLLFGIEAADPATFAAMLGLAILAALLAGALPSLRAGHVDPLSALRGT